MKWDELQQSDLESILRWAAQQPWAEQMSACQQDSQWHAEGDVWTHTQMVCRQLPELDDWQTLEWPQQLILVLTAIFHDSGKPQTSAVDPVSGRIRSPKHALKGAQIARRVLRELGCELSFREQVCRLVRYHSRPGFLSESSEPQHEVVRLSCILENRLLYLFAVADTRGRDARTEKRQEDELAYWKLLCQELGCYTRPYPFTTDHARYTFLTSKQPNLHYVPHEENSNRVVVMCGVPGSGKDTYLSEHYADLPTVSLDRVRRDRNIKPTDDQGEVVQIAMEQCREYLRRQESFAYNATNALVQTRQRWLGLFRDYGARVELVYVEPALPRLLEQNKNRAHPVPENVVLDLLEKCEPPTLWEGHSVTYVP